VFINNPIIIENLPGPQVNNVLVTPCIIGQNNGMIEIIASASSDTLYYSNNNGTTYQVSDSLFSFLAAGFYTCVVLDEYGCDTTFIIEVPEEITIRLQAVAGDDEVCPGNSAFVPLIVSNFNDVGNFRTTLLYNKDLLTCQGFANAHPQIEDSLEVMLFPAEGKVELNWSSAGVTLVDNTPMADLVFQSIDPGLSFVQWDGSPGASFFQNFTGVIIPVDYFIGNVKIYNNVSFTLNGTTVACKGDTLKLMPLVWVSNGVVNYLWTDPSGYTSSGDLMTINNIQANQAGEYYLIITDTLGCYADTTFEIILLPEPLTTFAGQDTIITEEPVELDAGDNYVSYVWSTGETDQYITADHNDWYSVVIQSAIGCYGEDSVYVFFLAPITEPIQPELYLPNAFTPNGDGLNDEFKVINPPDNLSSFQMYIYNRWGQLVFKSNNVSMGWDGKFKGEPCPHGSYVFSIEYSIGNLTKTQSGAVLLLR
jgi:gliding motility-associated-like protein